MVGLTRSWTILPLQVGLSHGRMITAAEIKADGDLTHLKVVDLADDDPYWLTLLEALHANRCGFQVAGIRQIPFC